MSNATLLNRAKANRLAALARRHSHPQGRPEPEVMVKPRVAVTAANLNAQPVNVTPGAAWLRLVA
jgi:hypothetical protein